VALWLWFTVLFANFAEALAEGRSKAQAASLRGLKRQTWAKRCHYQPAAGSCNGTRWRRRAAQGDMVLVEAGDVMPADGEVIDGVASVDESAITGESAPVIRESGGDFARSPAAPACCRTGSSCASRSTRARPSSTA
jgi:K+-transporting ATPase ATPase B chain